MRPPLPEYVPSNLTDDELLEVFRPSLSDVMFRRLELLSDKAEGERQAVSANLDAAEKQEALLRVENGALRNILNGMCKAWDVLQEHTYWSDHRKWLKAQERLQQERNTAETDFNI